MINETLYSPLEKKIISKINRFELSKKDFKEIKKIFLNKKVLVTGGAGSIGSQFCKDIFKFKFSKLFILDKDENLLTELNRDLILKQKRSNINYICSDLTSFNLDKFIKKNKIDFLLNFAAIKHVRSEENFDTIKYMIKTNSYCFLPKKKSTLKKLFSVSTDKSVEPTSMLGISKSLMEINMNNWNNKKKIFLSSARFANVSFSNGSFLKYVVDRIKSNKSFGVPINIKRYFITHREASSICLKSLLKRNNGKIIIPNTKEILKKDILILDLVNKILKQFNLRIKLTRNLSKKKIIKNKFTIFLNNKKLIGQKLFEKFTSMEEKTEKDFNDKSILKIDFPSRKNKIIKSDILDKKNFKELSDYLKKKAKFYKPPINAKKVSNMI